MTSQDTAARLRQVAVEDLAIGMYVAELDRPWVGTPFLFQGFEISSAQDLEQLRETCRHVFVDQGDTTDSDADRLSIQAPALSLVDHDDAAQATSALGTDLEAICEAGTTWNDQHGVRDELPRARDIQDQVHGVVHRVFDHLRAGGTLELEELSAAVNPMIDSVLRNRDALGVLTLLRRKDNYTYNHSVATAVWALLLGRHIGLDRDTLEQLALGGVLLDVGKTRVPDELLSRAGPLDSDEQALMRRHVDDGVQIVSATNASGEVLDAIRSHHERHDGSGYPHGLAGDEIPVVARIIGLADTYDAMISRRPYAAAQSSFAVVKALHRSAGRLFQGELIEQFMQAVGMFPTGSVVELNTGEVGIVVAQNPVRRLRPTVMLVLDRDKQRMQQPTTINLLREPTAKLYINHGLEPGAHGVDPEAYWL